MTDFKEKYKAFKSSARFYLNNKSLYSSQMETQKNSNSTYLKYLQEDITFVENTLSQVREKYGSAACLIVYMIFVEGRKQNEIAEEYHMTRRQLQYSVTKWMKKVFEGDSLESD